MDNKSKKMTLEELMDAFADYVSGGDIIASREIVKAASLISSARFEQKKTQQQFADYFGVTQGMISKWESGDYNFTIESLANICDKLNYDFSIEFSKNIESIKDCIRALPEFMYTGNQETQSTKEYYMISEAA